RNLNERVYQMPKIILNNRTENLLICVAGLGARSGFSANITNQIPDYQSMDNGQCFALYLYEEVAQEAEQDLIAEQENGSLRRRDAITDAGLADFPGA